MHTLFLRKKLFYYKIWKTHQHSSGGSGGKGIYFNSLTGGVANHSIDNTNVNNDLIEYFNDYQSFCLDLSLDKVLKNDFNFTNKYINNYISI